jgi:XRE family transcriptional regulator, regulator of sulfur utilization
MKKIGERIKKQREKMKLSLGKLATQVGVTASALSQIEKARSFPSIVTLKSIAENLNTTVGELIGENEQQMSSPVIRKDQMQRIQLGDNGAELMGTIGFDSHRLMDSFLLKLPPGADSRGILENYADQRVCIVLNGQVRLHLQDQNHMLKTGDYASFHSRTLQFIANETADAAEVAIVLCPPHR